jgi:two-component sensor histidine kinase
MRLWGVAAVLFGATVAAFGGSSVYMDRKATLTHVEDRTRSLSRMIAAHAEASIDHAVGVLDEIDAQISGWNFDDHASGRIIFDQTRAAIGRIPAFSSAWAVDAQGISRFDTWTYPAIPIESAERPYFKAHLASEDNELKIMGDPTPGSVTGQERFTISRAQRESDGTLRSVIVVAVYSFVFDALYEQAANWPDARGGLYSRSGDILARIRQPVRASPEFISAMERNVDSTATGSAILSDGGQLRLVSWHRLAAYPSLYATSSQTLTAALADWRLRSAITFGIILIAITLFGLFAFMSARTTQAKQRIVLQDTMIREVHHRVKNALALVVSMIRMQVRKEEDQPVQDKLNEVALRIQAVAETQDLLQSAHTLEATDVGVLLKRLCERLDEHFGKAVTCEVEMGIEVDASRATTIAIIANELITNGLKHAGSTVFVTCRTEGYAIVVNINSIGASLEEDFELQSSPGFGLRMARAMADASGGELLARTGTTGVEFELRLPLQPG